MMYATFEGSPVLDGNEINRSTGRVSKIMIRPGDQIESPRGFETVLKTQTVTKTIYRLIFQALIAKFFISLAESDELKLFGTDEWVRAKDARRGQQLESKHDEPVTLLYAEKIEPRRVFQIITESGSYFLGGLLVRPAVAEAK